MSKIFNDSVTFSKKRPPAEWSSYEISQLEYGVRAGCGLDILGQLLTRHGSNAIMKKLGELNLITYSEYEDEFMVVDDNTDDGKDIQRADTMNLVQNICIETKTYINGVDLASYTSSQIYEMIGMIFLQRMIIEDVDSTDEEVIKLESMCTQLVNYMLGTI